MARRSLILWLALCLAASWFLRERSRDDGGPGGPGGTGAVEAEPLPAAAAAEATEARVAGARSRPVPLRAGRVSREHAVGAGESIQTGLAAAGLAPMETRRLAEQLEIWAPGGRFGTDGALLLEGVDGQHPDRITVPLDADRVAILSLRGAQWSARLDSFPVRRDTLAVSGEVARAIWDARLGGDAERLNSAQRAWVGGELTRVFQWQLDAFQDVAPGDRFAVVLEREIRGDGSIRGLSIVGARYVSAEATFEAFRFRETGASEPSYYDGDGTSIRGPFLRSPLAVVRITSRFSARRFHPVLGRYRSHQGIDYGAPTGTAVRATGDGRVLRAGPWGDYGIVIELEHGQGIRTRYAHLSAVAEGVRPGQLVDQGQTIGQVGSTGLSTAPHLHYEFLQRGVATDPDRVDLPVERPLADAARPAFAGARLRLEDHLDRLDRVPPAR